MSDPGAALRFEVEVEIEDEIDIRTDGITKCTHQCLDVANHLDVGNLIGSTPSAAKSSKMDMARIAWKQDIRLQCRESPFSHLASKGMDVGHGT